MQIIFESSDIQAFQSTWTIEMLIFYSQWYVGISSSDMKYLITKIVFIICAKQLQHYLPLLQNVLNTFVKFSRWNKLRLWIFYIWVSIWTIFNPIIEISEKTRTGKFQIRTPGPENDVSKMISSCMFFAINPRINAIFNTNDKCKSRQHICLHEQAV